MDEPRETTGNRVADGGPWGLGKTVGFGVVVAALWIATQGIATVILAGGANARGRDVSSQGWVVAAAAIIGAPVAVGASLLLARARRGVSISAYLGLTWPPARQALRWFLTLLALSVASDSLSLALGRPLVPEPMIAVYRTAGSLPIFLFGFVVAAPLAEEFLFRGFLFAGVINSRLGPPGAIALTALAFGALHAQYDLYGIATVVAAGVLLGLVRWQTGSLWLCAILHGLMNVIATAEVAFTFSTR